LRIHNTDQNFAEFGVGPVFGDAAHVIEELFFRVGSEIGFRDFVVRQVRHQRA
jgi:hypothetical protein